MLFAVEAAEEGDDFFPRLEGVVAEGNLRAHECLMLFLFVAGHDEVVAQEQRRPVGEHQVAVGRHVDDALRPLLHPLEIVEVVVGRERNEIDVVRLYQVAHRLQGRRPLLAATVAQRLYTYIYNRTLTPLLTVNIVFVIDIVQLPVH